MAWYKPEHKDIIKIVPIIKYDGSTTYSFNTNSVFYKNKYIFDDLNKDYLSRLWNIHKKNPISNDVHYVQRSYFSVYINGKISFMGAPTSLRRVIMESMLDIYPFDDKHVRIKKEAMNSSYFTFENSNIIEQEWDKPFNEIDWLKTNQPFYFEEYITNNNFFKNIDLLKEAFGVNAMCEIISDDRDNKINDIID